MTTAEYTAALKLVLDAHKAWLADPAKGVRLDLRAANLSWANLRESNLRAADLREADLGWANLRETNLRAADLREADLSEAAMPDGAD